MPSPHGTLATGRPLLLRLAHLHVILLFLCSCGARGASLREHRLRGVQPDSPGTDMLQALQLIESLRQRTGADPRQRGPLGRPDDAEGPRAASRLAPDEEDEGEGEEEGGEDRSEELLQAVLATLRQTEKAARPASRPGPTGDAYPRVRQRQHAIRPHKRLPLMFEDDEDEEEEEEDGRGGEGEGGPGLELESPYKRTKENVEEKYTPQNLATLQSVFDELDKLTGAKASRKRQEEEEEEEEDAEGDGEDEGDDVFHARSAAYDGEAEDLADWGPSQEREEEGEEAEAEEEEEERENKRGANRGLDYLDGNDEEADEVDAEEDEDGYPVKRSNDPDDMANLVDFYLLKVLEKTEEEEHKREVEEEERERAERRASQARHRDDIDPRAVYRLIQISQKYQIPPEDLVDMLQTGAATGQGKARTPSRRPPTPSRKTHQSPGSYDRLFPARPKTPEEVRTEEILSILGLGVGEDQAPVEKQRKSPASRLHASPPRRPGGSAAAAAQRRRPPGPPEDDATDEDELAAYLAARVLARYPEPAYGGKKASQKRDEAGQTAGGSLASDYFDQADSGEKRRSEDEEEGGDAQKQGLDNEAMMKLLTYLSPEAEESNADAKSAQGYK